jgi:Ca2+-binding RTX toxin-like protein
MATREGNSSNNKLDGTKGSDELYGYKGRDTLSGLGGNDYLYGGDDDYGSDVLIGGKGDDTLYSGVGNDTLRGGLGADRFIMTDYDHNDEFIEDFNPDQDDTIEIVYPYNYGISDFEDITYNADTGELSDGNGEYIVAVLPGGLNAEDVYDHVEIIL